MAATTQSFPTGVGAFIGRESDVVRARRNLQRHRLVTLLGDGGIGKTTLAQHLAASEAPAFADGVHVVSLVHVAAGEDVPFEVGRAMGVFDNAPNALERLIDHVQRHPRMLLVIDDCQKFVEPVRELVTQLLQAAEQLRIIATSRVKIDAPGEKLLRIDPLHRIDAVRLLVYRGAAVRPEWQRAVEAQPELSEKDLAVTFTAEDLLAARELCGLLGDLPLGIKIIATFLGGMPLRTALRRAIDRVRNRLKTLVAAEFNQPNHKSLMAALGTSYAELSGAAQWMWQVAATFTSEPDSSARGGFEGGFDLPAAQAVALAIGIKHADVADALDELVRHSVLGWRVHAGHTRYTMLPPTRIYGQQLTSAHDQQRLRAAFTTYYADLVAAADAGWFSPLQVDWMHRLQSDRPNLRFALDELGDRGEHERAMLLAVQASMTMFQVFAGQLHEGTRWVTSALARYPHEDELAVTALALGAWVSLIQGTDEWPPLLARCRAVARTAGCTTTSVALLLTEATRICWTEPDPETARTSIGLFQQAAKLASDGWSFMATLFGVFAANFHGEHEVAARMTTELVVLAESVDAPWCRGWVLWATSLHKLLHTTDWWAAMRDAQEALGMALRMGDTWLPGWALWLMACIAATLRQAGEAAYLFGAAARYQHNTRVLVGGLLPWLKIQDRLHAELREALGAPQFDAQFELGGAATQETLMERALGFGATQQPAAQSAVALGRLRSRDQQGSAGEGDVATLDLLDPRVREVVERVARGLRDKEIAEELGLSPRTVEQRVRQAMRKFDVSTRYELVARVESAQFGTQIRGRFGSDGRP